MLTHTVRGDIVRLDINTSEGCGSMIQALDKICAFVVH